MTSCETILFVRLETSGGVLLTMDMVVQWCDGPRQLCDHDGDGDECQLTSWTWKIGYKQVVHFWLDIFWWNCLFLLVQSVKSKMATVEPMQISSHTVDKVAKAKLTLETYYSNLVTQHAERENRYVYDQCVTDRVC